MKYLISILALGIFLISCNQKQSTKISSEKNNAVKDSLTAELLDLQSNGLINGFSVAIVNEEKVLYKNAFGFSDVSTNEPYTVNTLQNIASISKTLIGIALLKAQELGNLQLDDPISKYLDFDIKNPYYPDEAITIRQLATHTSSITDGEIYDEKSYIQRSTLDSTASEKMRIPEEFNPPSEMISIEEFMRKVLEENGTWYSKEIFLNERPGQLFEYSNIGATLAALVIESATGENFNEFTKKNILQPLGMNSSGWSYDEIDFSKHSKLYAEENKQIPFYSLITYPDGGLITSIDDFSKYLVELIRGYSGNGTLLSITSYDEFYRLQLKAENFKERDENNPYNDEYNFGIFVGLSAKDYIGHTGGDPGVSSFMFFNSENRIGRILIINTDLTNEEGVQQFTSIWNKLEEYQLKIE